MAASAADSPNMYHQNVQFVIKMWFRGSKICQTWSLNLAHNV